MKDLEKRVYEVLTNFYYLVDGQTRDSETVKQLIVDMKAKIDHLKEQFSHLAELYEKANRELDDFIAKGWCKYGDRYMVIIPEEELNRLKSKQVRLRPMEELKKTPFKDALCLHDGGSMFLKFEVACYWDGEGEERFRNEFTILKNPVGWIELFDLPMEMEE